MKITELKKNGSTFFFFFCVQHIHKKLSYDESDGDQSDVTSIHSKDEEDYKKGDYPLVQFGDRFDNNK